jgi:alkylated DNA repair dioxygenase AlkB
VSPSPDLSWQPSIFEGIAEVAIHESFSSLERIQLDSHSWLDVAPGWVTGSDRLFAELVATADWSQRSRRMYDRVLPEPRLTSVWRKSSDLPLEPPILERMRRILSGRYSVELDSMGLNLYRDGRDSVAWHRDRIAKELAEPVVGHRVGG